MGAAPYPYDRVKATIYGRIASVQDWSIGLTLIDNGGGFSSVSSDLSALAAAILTKWVNNTTSLSAWASLQSSQVTTLGCATYHYPAGATVALGQGNSSGAPIPGTGSAKLPSQVALVASLRTAFPGRSARGRLYLPLLGLSATPLGASSEMHTVCSQVASFITGVNTITYGPSHTAISTVVGHDARVVTNVVVDNVLDTQRRRRDKMAATDIETQTV